MSFPGCLLQCSSVSLPLILSSVEGSKLNSMIAHVIVCCKPQHKPRAPSPLLPYFKKVFLFFTIFCV